MERDRSGAASATVGQIRNRFEGCRMVRDPVAARGLCWSCHRVGQKPADFLAHVSETSEEITAGSTAAVAIERHDARSVLKPFESFRIGSGSGDRFDACGTPCESRARAVRTGAPVSPISDSTNVKVVTVRRFRLAGTAAVRGRTFPSRSRTAAPGPCTPKSPSGRSSPVKTKPRSLNPIRTRQGRSHPEMVPHLREMPLVVHVDPDCRAHGTTAVGAAGFSVARWRILDHRFGMNVKSIPKAPHFTVSRVNVSLCAMSYLD